MIYWDHNATSPLHPKVAEALARAHAGGAAFVGNPASVHGPGRAARQRLQAARERVARGLGAQPRDIAFVGSGSEANALALKGAFFGRPDKAKRRLVSSSVEHPAVLFALEQLKAHGAEVVLVPPGPDGAVPAAAMLGSLTEDTLLCSLMWANNETGVLQPVQEVSRGCRQRGVLFHADAVQAAGKVPLSQREVPADLLTLSAHKLGGPPGAAALVAGRGVALEALVAGHQEGGRRGGTPDVAAFEGLALALELAQEELDEASARVRALRDAFEAQVLARVPGASVNGGSAPRVPNTSNVRFPGVDGEALLIALDLEGIAVSAGAACASGSVRPSHVLTAMGLTAAEARASLRFSLGRGSSEAELQTVVEALARLVPRAKSAD